MATKTDLFVAVAHFANGVKAQIIAAPTDTNAKADLVAACIRAGFELPCVSVEAFPVDARELKHLLADVPLHIPSAPAVQTIHVGGLLRALSTYRSQIALSETEKGRDALRAFFNQFYDIELDFKGEP